MGNIKEFDYYIYIDYSENLIGYIIIANKNKFVLLQKTSQFRHFKELRNKDIYLLKIKRIIYNNQILPLINKIRILSVRDSLSIFTYIIEFINKNEAKILLITLDDKEYTAFIRIFSKCINKENITIMKESELKKGSIEYRLSLIIDNMLNIERRNKINKPNR
jgi:hypothetical protein